MKEEKETLNKFSYKNLKFLWNRYFLFGTAFLIWMICFDQNSYLVHRELDRQIQSLGNDKRYYKQHLEEENYKLNQLLKNPSEMERIAREKHFLKRPNEDIFIITDVTDQ